MSEIIDLRDIRLSRMTEEELMAHLMDLIATHLQDVNKSLKSLTERLCTVELTVSSLSGTFPSHEEELQEEH